MRGVQHTNTATRKEEERQKRTILVRKMTFTGLLTSWDFIEKCRVRPNTVLAEYSAKQLC